MWRSGQTSMDGTDTGMQNAMQLWSERLAGFADQPERLRKALTALPSHPPSLPEFIALCRQQSSDAANKPRQHTTGGATKQAARRREAPDRANAAFIQRFGKCLSASTENMLGWAEKPPPAGMRASWTRAILECARRGDPRFLRLLNKYIADGTIRRDEAGGIAQQEGRNESEK